MTTMIRPTANPNDWRVTRKVGTQNFSLYGHYATLGNAAAAISNAHRWRPSRWRLNGVEVSGTANAAELGAALAETWGEATILKREKLPHVVATSDNGKIILINIMHCVAVDVLPTGTLKLIAEDVTGLLRAT